ncbi:hypothetical protein ACFQ6U_35230 [Streptomyces sp. NPDC056465]|uniref:hypothetical protein n=1 Tax=unclassified Streptomyces TaxID=2593676 RepID=UPI0035D9D075
MRRCLGTTAAVTGAVVVALAAPAATAGAAAPAWTVGPSSPTSFSGAAGAVRFQWGINGYIPMTCPSSAVRGDLASAPGATGVQVGTIAPLTWSGCSSPFGPMNPVADTSTPWKLVADSHTVGTTSGYVSGVRLTLTMLTCSMVASGRLAFTYTNSTARMKVHVDGAYGITVQEASPGCAGLAAVGDTWSYDATYSVVAPAGGTAGPTIVHTP